MDLSANLQPKMAGACVTRMAQSILVLILMRCMIILMIHMRIGNKKIQVKYKKGSFNLPFLLAIIITNKEFILRRVIF
ncbi:MAG: hypothetical protein DRQ88_12795 [Epsilonproteobacteria bacterium]|nr:MAG: hypothetical protein DRQ88_12795 [Campylobacterota bacterium]